MKAGLYLSVVVTQPERTGWLGQFGFGVGVACLVSLASRVRVPHLQPGRLAPVSWLGANAVPGN